MKATTPLLVLPVDTGKTTFLAKQVSKIVDAAAGFTVGDQSPVLVCSLTKAAAAEAAGRDMPLKEEAVATMHAHGYRAMGMPTVAGGKTLESWNKKQPAYALSTSQIADDDDLNRPASGEAPGDRLFMLYHLMRHNMTPRDQWPDDVAHFGKCWDRWKEENICVDYTDMIEMAPDECPMGAGVVIVDEAQDMSRLELSKLIAWGKSAGAMITVGDPYQALYTWRGADPNFMMRDRGSDKFKVLSQSYRIPQAVHTAAVNWLSRISNYQPIDYKPTEHEGQCMMFDAGFRDVEAVIHEATELAFKGKSVMLITSCNFMANQVAAQLKHAGVPYSNPWRTSNAAWNPLGIRKGTSTRQRIISLLRPARPVHGDDRRGWTVEEFHQWSSVLAVDGFLRRGARKQIEELATTNPKDKVDSRMLAKWCEPGSMFAPSFFERLWSWFEATDKGGVVDCTEVLNLWRSQIGNARTKVTVDFLISLVDKWGYKALSEPPRIHIGTIHSFKGGEADAVFVFPDITLKTYEGWSMGSGDSYDSVVRGYYVAMTRARESLYLCRPSGNLFVDF